MPPGRTQSVSWCRDPVQAGEPLDRKVRLLATDRRFRKLPGWRCFGDCQLVFLEFATTALAEFAQEWGLTPILRKAALDERDVTVVPRRWLRLNEAPLSFNPEPAATGYSASGIVPAIDSYVIKCGHRKWQGADRFSPCLRQNPTGQLTCNRPIA